MYSEFYITLSLYQGSALGFYLFKMVVNNSMSHIQGGPWYILFPDDIDLFNESSNEIEVWTWFIETNGQVGCRWIYEM